MKFPTVFSCSGCGSKPRLLGMLGMTASFMLVELVVGNLTNSMALVADSFHMLSDVIALIIAYISIKMSPKEWSKNTFGWARAEVGSSCSLSRMFHLPSHVTGGWGSYKCCLPGGSLLLHICRGHEKIL